MKKKGIASFFKKLKGHKLILKMKLTFLILLGCMMQVSATVYSQATKFSFNVEDKQVVDLLKEIQDQSDFRFFYQREQVDVTRKVNLNVSDKSIEVILDQLFEGQGIAYNVLENNLIVITPKSDTFTSIASQQQKRVSGKVTDSAGATLPGVSVVLKGTTIGVITDNNGNFSISNIPGDAILQFSFVGMKSQEIAIGNKTSINVTMAEETVGLEEVVAIGYGTMKKSDLTGTVVSADIKAFRESPNVSIVQSLQGSVPGLVVGQVNAAGQNPSMMIRGQNSFQSSLSSPLIVLDGIIYQGSLTDINPSDIETVDVLKDASSAAIYGSQSANGVIIFTTKKGKDSGKPIFNFSSSYTLQTPTSPLKLLDRKGYIQRMNDALWDKGGYLAPDYKTINSSFDPSIFWTRPSLLEAYKAGTEYDWWKATTQTGHIQENNVSMRGKTESTSYFISTGYTNQLGFIMNDKYKRYTIRMNVENKILDWFKIGVQSFISSSDYSGITPELSIITYQSPMNTPYDKDGNLLVNPSDVPALNPFYSSQVDNLEKSLRLSGIFYADISIPFIKGLSYRLNYSQNYITGRSYYFSKFDNNFNGASYKSNSVYNSSTLDNILTYSKEFNKHNINLTLVTGQEQGESESTKAEATNFGMMALGYNGLEVGTIPLVSSSAGKSSSLYYMGRLHYSYNNKYLATLTVRRDGFSGFSVNNKFGIFPSGALAWVVSEENFMKKNQKIINFLKLRASYGANGNRSLGSYGTLSHVGASQGYVFGDGSSPYLVQGISTLGNTGLKWETTTGTNLGIDFAILNQRIRGNVEYYNSNTSNILFNVNIPVITGYSSIPDNIGKIHNSGTEFSITGSIIRQKDFNWDMTLNFWRNRNKVVSVLGIDNNKDGIEDDLIANGLFIGKPMGVVYNYVAEGLYQIGDTDIPKNYYPGQWRRKDLNNDGVITPDKDRQITGYTDPAYRFSINNHFQYKNWSLRIFINSVQGGKDGYYGANNPLITYGLNHNNTFKWDWWSPANPKAEYPQLYYETPGGYTVYKQRNFVRLQDVSLSYTFDKRFTDKIGIKDLKIYLAGKNLYTWTKWNGWDPETGQGIQATSPVLKGCTFGLDFSF